MKKLLVMMMVSVLVLGNCVACGSGAGNDGKNEGSQVENETSVVTESQDEGKSEEETVPVLNNWFEVSLNGKVYELPARVSDFLDGDNMFYTEESVEDLRGEYWNRLEMYNKENDMFVGTAFTYYDVLKEHAVGDEYVYWFKFERMDVEFNNLSLVFYGGLTFDSSYEDVVAIFGEPSDDNGQGGYRWEEFCQDGDEYCISELSVYFKDGKIDKISIMHQNSESRFK